MKFIDFGKRENKSTLIEKFYKNKNYKYNLKIYYPFLSFFMNEENYKIYKNLNNTQDKEFIHFLEHFFFNTPYVSSTTSANRNDNLNKLKIQFRDTEELRKYKNYIQSTYDKNFFKDVLSSFRNTYLRKNQSYKTFIKYTINIIDIYGLSLSLLHFITSIKNNYSIDNDIYGPLSICLKELTNNTSTLIHSRRNIPEKAYIYFKIILENIRKKKSDDKNKKNNKNNNNNNKNNNNINNKQFSISKFPISIFSISTFPWVLFC